MVKIVKDGVKWSKLSKTVKQILFCQNGPKCSKIVTSGSKWSKMVKDISKWSKMVGLTLSGPDVLALATEGREGRSQEAPA